MLTTPKLKLFFSPYVLMLGASFISALNKNSPQQQVANCICLAVWCWEGGLL